jgi:uncharacterized protein
MVEVILRAVRVDVGSSTPLLLLEEVGGDRVLPIFIGAPEAAAIAYALNRVETPRPMSHDLLSNVITALGGRLFAVEINELVDNTFYATVRILKGDEEVAVSARPSDAVALALRSGAPILVSDHLIEEQGKIIDLSEIYDEDEEEEVDEEELVAELAEFLENINPEDFQL